MGILAPGSGLIGVQTFLNQAADSSYIVNPGNDVYRVSVFMKCAASAAGTRQVTPQVAYVWGDPVSPANPFIGAAFTLGDVTFTANFSCVFNHDGTGDIVCSMPQTVAGVGDTYDVTWILEKLYEDTQS